MSSDKDVDARIDAVVKLGGLAPAPLILAAAIGYAVYLGTAWSWPLLLWGAVLGPLTTGGMRGIMAVARRKALPLDEWESDRRRSWRRYWPTYVGLAVDCLAVGIVSASQDDSFLDLLMTGLVVLWLLTSAVTMWRLLARSTPGTAG